MSVFHCAGQNTCSCQVWKGNMLTRHSFQFTVGECVVRVIIPWVQLSVVSQSLFALCYTIAVAQECSPVDSALHFFFFLDLITYLSFWWMFRVFKKRKQAKMLWIQDLSQSNVDNLNNARCEATRHFRHKKKKYLKAKIKELETNS